jgi:hypothetical protein
MLANNWIEITFSSSFNCPNRKCPFLIFPFCSTYIRNFKWLLPSERNVQILHRDYWFHSSSLIFRFHLEVREVSDCWLPPSGQNSSCFHFRTNSDPWKFQLWKGWRSKWAKLLSQFSYFQTTISDWILFEPSLLKLFLNKNYANHYPSYVAFALANWRKDFVDDLLKNLELNSIK